MLVGGAAVEGVFPAGVATVAQVDRRHTGLPSAVTVSLAPAVSAPPCCWGLYMEPRGIALEPDTSPMAHVSR